MKVETELQGVDQSLKSLSAFIEREEQALKEALEFILRSMVNYVKKNGPWRDRTGNLRNSISANIKEMQEWDEDTDPSKLRAKATELEEPVIEVEGDDYRAVLSAGMEYAIWVELKSGYWVLQGAIDKFEPLINKYFQDKMSVQEMDLERIAEIQYAKKYGEKAG